MRAIIHRSLYTLRPKDNYSYCCYSAWILGLWKYQSLYTLRAGYRSQALNRPPGAGLDQYHNLYTLRFCPAQAFSASGSAACTRLAAASHDLSSGKRPGVPVALMENVWCIRTWDFALLCLLPTISSYNRCYWLSGIPCGYRSSAVIPVLDWV